MKISNVKVEDLINYCNAYQDDATKKDMESILLAVKSYIKGYTSLNDEQLDQYEDLTLVLMAISNEMYDNRNFTVSEAQINPIYESILNLHRRNLL